MASFAALAALGLDAACAANGDPPSPSTVPATPSALGNPIPTATAQASPVQASPTSTPLDARDVAVLVVAQTPAALRVTSSASRPRASFGPSASWNGSGAPTHRWVLRDALGRPLASGDIVARSTLEAPPNPAQGAAAAHVPQDTFSFVARVPQPAAGEIIEIATVGGGDPQRKPGSDPSPGSGPSPSASAPAAPLVVRWP